MAVLQETWGYRVVPPWEVVSASWAHVAARGHLIEALNLLSLLGFGLLALAGARRLPLAYTLYTWPYLGLLFFRQMSFSPLMSVSRYTLVLFRCFIVLALWLAQRPGLAIGWLAIGALLESLLLGYWAGFGFVA